MIQNVYVNGFKSLKNFHLDLKAGLNVLVGPNGSGKTNIISFFEFLTYLNTRDIYGAISLMGGAGTIFTKNGADEQVEKIQVKITGYVKINERRHLYYQYGFHIAALINEGTVMFTEQHLSLVTKAEKKNPVDWDLDIVHVIDPIEKKSATYLLSFNAKKIKNSLYNKHLDEKELELLLDDRPLYDYTILEFLRRYMIDTVRICQRDLIGGETFNIIPTRVKQVEDIASPPGIQKDGSGLASTLYALQTYKREIFRNRYIRQLRLFPVRRAPNLFKKIVEICTRANDSITGIEIRNNTFDNQLIVRVNIRTEDGELSLPLSMMSDGSIKWLALITAILTSNNIFSIEEPENYLHPWMQQEIITILRENFIREHDDSFVLMSTHSETIINAVKPSEILIVKMKDANTVVKRVQNIGALNREINDTGFGLGYYYIAGALD